MWLVEVYEIDRTNSGSKLVNISTRSLVRSAAEVQIAGFVISGSAPKPVIIRASGPALTQYGVPGVLADPKIELYSGSSSIAQNDNWGAPLRTEFLRLGLDNRSVGSNDAAFSVTLDPGAYTVIVSGKSSASGVALVEVFEKN